VSGAVTVPPGKLGPLIRAYYRQPGLVWLYAIQMGEAGPIKLGVTLNPAERIATLQQGNPETLHGLAAWRAMPVEEKELHEEFAYARVRGEWFRPVPELVDLVLRLGCEFDDWTPLTREEKEAFGL